MKESQIIEFKETWRDEYLKWICGFANAEGGTLVIGKNDQGDAVGVLNAAKLMEDPFSPEYLQIIASPSEPDGRSVKTGGKASEKTSEKILQAVRENNQITIAELAEISGVTTRSVERNIQKLQDTGRLNRIGPDKGGRWEVLK